MFDLEQAISERRPTLLFLPDKAVPRALVDEALELAIGYPDPAFPANNLRIERNPVEQNVTFLDS
jgi:hypothetical protein